MARCHIFAHRKTGDKCGTTRRSAPEAVCMSCGVVVQLGPAAALVWFVLPLTRPRVTTPTTTTTTTTMNKQNSNILVVYYYYYYYYYY